MHSKISIFPVNGDQMPDVKIVKAREHFALLFESLRSEYGIHCKTLDELLDLGYAIIAAVNKAKAPADAEPAFVPFAINDAVEHEEAMATMPANYDPDRIVEMSVVEDPNNYDAPVSIQCGSHEEAVALAKKLNDVQF